MNTDNPVRPLISTLANLMAGRVEARPGEGGYRPDIDGLRAIAVLAVMAYHLGFRPAPGGFVGVDVFFVISGYLIGALVFADVRAGQFSFMRFYVRRIRRLFPALFVMLAATGLASAWVLYPETYHDFGESLAAAVASTSNIYFWLTSDYFDTASLTNPLLHTWSLSVEEQFYLVFPPLALAIVRFAPKHAGRVMLLVGAASFACYAASTLFAPEAAFYLLPNRAWELALGIYLAVTPALMFKPALRTPVAVSGLILIGASILFFKEELAGLAPVPACIGAAMIIAAQRGGGNWVSAALSWRPLVFTGLISYSLYLWHWPIIVLYQYRFGETFLALTEKLELAGVIFALSVLSWLFVERPFRRGSSPTSRVFYAAGAGAAVIAVAAFAIVVSQGFPRRFDADVVRLASYLEYRRDLNADDQVCLLNGTREVFADFDQARCLRRAPDRPNILLVGDSHAANLREGLTAVLPRANIMQATATQCRAVVRGRLRDAAGCRALMDFLYREYLPHNRVDLLVLAGRWSPADGEAVAETLRELEDMRVPVVVIGPFPRYQGAVPQLVALARQDRDPTLPQRRLRPRAHLADHEFRVMTERLGVRYASAYDVLCPQHQCIQLSQTGVPLQHDYGHLTREGSLFLVDRLNRLGAFAIGAPSATLQGRHGEVSTD